MIPTMKRYLTLLLKMKAWVNMYKNESYKYSKDHTKNFGDKNG